jgi:hypothetical protein
MFDNWRTFTTFVIVIRKQLKKIESMRTNIKHMVIISKSQFMNCWYPRVSYNGSELSVR